MTLYIGRVLDSAFMPVRTSLRQIYTGITLSDSTSYLYASGDEGTVTPY